VSGCIDDATAISTGRLFSWFIDSCRTLFCKPHRLRSPDFWKLDSQDIRSKLRSILFPSALVGVVGTLAIIGLEGPVIPRLPSGIRTSIIVLRTLTLNGLLGIAFGYLYWTRGLESAMFSHFCADLLLHVVLAFSVRQ
jgi:hypothetical protein